MPQIDFNYYRNDLANGWLDFKLFSQAARFDNDSALMPTAWRFHTEPSLTTVMSNKYGNLNIETKLYATHYNQKKGSSSAAEEVQKSVNRVLPQLKVDLQTVLATNKTLFDGYTQTLEPHEMCIRDRFSYFLRAIQAVSPTAKRCSCLHIRSWRTP